MAKFTVALVLFAMATIAIAAPPALEQKGVEKKEGDLQTASSFYGGFGYPGFGYGYGYPFYGGYGYGGYGYPGFYGYRGYGYGFPFYGGYYG